jgi:hypothetical protein
MPSNIVAPRVPLTDPETGLIAREWYRFFHNLFVLTGAGQSVMSVTDLQVGPTSTDTDEIRVLLGHLTPAPSDGVVTAQVAALVKVLQGARVTPPVPDGLGLMKAVWVLQGGPISNGLAERVAVLTKAVQELQVTPVAIPPRTVLTATATLDFPNTLAGAASDLTMSLPGAVSGDVVALGVPAASVPANGSYFAWASAPDTITVRYTNPDLILAYNPASGVFRATVTRP